LTAAGMTAPPATASIAFKQVLRFKLYPPG
jgi:hypothetical protein